MAVIGGETSQILDRSAGPCTLRSTFYVRKGKRIFDLFVATAALIASTPFLLICAIAIRLNSPGPILFRQRRVGQHGKAFEIIKLRSMVDRGGHNGSNLTISNDPRVTAVGKWLRKTKADEIPQLVNVLRGEMSLVGPRPETADHVALYNRIQRRVLEVKPGLTGRASVAFVNEEKILANQPDTEHYYVTTVMPRKLQYDLTYCGSVSFLGDLILMLKTIAKLFIND